MHPFTQEICQRCESDYATRKSPYCPRCAKLHQEAEELTDRIMANGFHRPNPDYVEAPLKVSMLKVVDGQVVTGVAHSTEEIGDFIKGK